MGSSVTKVGGKAKEAPVLGPFYGIKAPAFRPLSGLRNSFQFVWLRDKPIEIDKKMLCPQTWRTEFAVYLSRPEVACALL